MNKITIYCCIISIVLCSNTATENHASFAEFSTDRVDHAVQEIHQLYSSKNKKAAIKLTGIGLASILGYCYVQQNRAGQTDKTYDIDDLAKIITQQNSWGTKAQGALGTTLFGGITWCVQDIWKQFFDKPEYDYFKKSFYYFEVHLSRIKHAVEAYENDYDMCIAEFAKNELTASFNDMVNSLEQILAVMDFISNQEKVQSESILFYKKYLIKQVAALAKNLDSVLIKKQETSVSALAIKDATEIKRTVEKLIDTYPALRSIQEEISMAQRVKRMEAKVDAIGNFLIKDPEREEA